MGSSSATAGASVTPVPASACQTSGRLSPVIASRSCRSPSRRVMTIQSRSTTRDGAWLSAMDESRPVKTYSRSACGAETMKASAPTVSRFGPRREIHTPRVPPNPPVPRTLARWRGARKDAPASMSLRSGAFPPRSRLRRTKRYAIPQRIATAKTNSTITPTSFATLSMSGVPGYGVSRSRLPHPRVRRNKPPSAPAGDLRPRLSSSAAGKTHGRSFWGRRGGWGAARRGVRG